MSQVIAKEILKQLGGYQFNMMTGARNHAAIKDGLSFRIPGHGFSKGGINYVKIVLMPSDTYDVEFARIRGTKYTVVSQYSDVYNDQLREIFREATGLSTSLS